MKILCIGNSFSTDATRYLYGIARADGVKLKVVNLYIGGCSLYRHYRNMLSGEKAYLMELDGMSSGFYVSLKDALLSDEWDIVTLQQASHASPHWETYEPYIVRLADYVREHAPAAKLYIHQTWAYEAGCPRLMNMAKLETAEEMLERLTKNYRSAAKLIEADGIIPAGEMLAALHAKGFAPIHRDTFHLGRGIPRYAVGLLWYRMLTGHSVLENTFCDLDEAAEAKDIALAKETVEAYSPIQN